MILLLTLALGIQVSLTADPPAARLADAVTVTLTVTGPPSLRVAVPADPLDPDSAGAWKLTPVGPADESVPGRWERRYRADPFQPGEVRLGLVPLAVTVDGRTESLPVPPLTVRVTTGVTGVSPVAARPPTGPEVPPDPRRPDRPPRWAVWAAGTVCGLTGVLVVVARWRNRASRRVPNRTEAFAGRLEHLASADVPAAEFAHRLSDAVRDVLHTDTVPTRQWTTPEFPPGPARELLTALDAVRFGGGGLTAGDRAAMLAAARDLGNPVGARGAERGPGERPA